MQVLTSRFLDALGAYAARKLDPPLNDTANQLSCSAFSIGREQESSLNPLIDVPDEFIEFFESEEGGGGRPIYNPE